MHSHSPGAPNTSRPHSLDRRWRPSDRCNGPLSNTMAKRRQMTASHTAVKARASERTGTQETVTRAFSQRVSACTKKTIDSGGSGSSDQSTSHERTGVAVEALSEDRELRVGGSADAAQITHGLMSVVAEGTRTALQNRKPRPIQHPHTHAEKNEADSP